MRVALVLGLLGQMLVRFAAVFVAPLVLAAWDGVTREVIGFAVGGVVAAAGGALLGRLRTTGTRVHRSETLATVAGAWLVMAAAAGVPLLFVGLSPVNALFEAMSGLTTTGGSVFTDFSAYGRAVFLWRAILHWIGGLGVIALFVVVLPSLGIAGRQLFFTEASAAADEGIAPQVRRVARRLWSVYATLTLSQTALLSWYGMPTFDALCNAMATTAAGGFSPHGAGILGYANPACEWVFVAYMFLAGANVALLWRVASGRPLAFFRDPEFRAYTAVVVVAVALVALQRPGTPWAAETLREAAFQVTSIISTTGFASTDYNQWADGARMVLILLMFVGGCAGSAAGGPKVVRCMIVGKHCGRELVRTLHPQAVLPLRLGRAILAEDVLRAVVAFLVVYITAWAATSTALVVLGMDLVSGATAAIACLSNVGPGLGSVGPMANYDHLSDAATAVLVAAMWIGRLEVMTVLALLRWDVLGHLRWRGGGNR